MPLVKRKQVQYLPLPKGIQDGTIPPEQQVWQIRETGEIFTEYEFAYYMEPIFTCEYTGKSGLTYFNALESEQAESEKTQKAFYDVLKPRVLRACHFQVEGRLERLVDLTFERFNNRYFLNDCVIVNDVNQYYAIVIRVTPPKHIRDLLRPENAQILATVLNNGRFDPSEISSDTPDNDGLDYTAEQLDSVAHIVGARQLEIETTEANKVDDPEAYIYSVQLLQGLNFDGSIINASSKHMERDRTKWNKALLKKYLKESITRDPAVGSPWMCKERLRLEYGFPLELPEHLKVKSNELRVDLLQRRRKQPKEEDPNAPPKAPKAKRQKLDSGAASRRDSSNALTPLPSDDPQSSTPRNSYIPSALGVGGSGPSNAALVLDPSGDDGSPNDAAALAAAAAAQSRNMPKPKYPMEDLDLDPTTILDGRVRRSKHLALPPLPKKPIPRKDLPVPEEHMDRTLMCWNVLNIFGQALQISPFTLDDFINALQHDTLEPRCILLGEIHSVLTNNIAAESHGLPANLKASVDSIPLLAATVENTDGMSVPKREMWVNAALDYSRGWDRKARPRAADGRKGWERHLMGILTQKGGLEAVASLPTIFKHLFTDEDYVSEAEEELLENDEDEEKKVEIEINGNDDEDVQQAEENDEATSKEAVRQNSPATSNKREPSASSEADEEAVVKPEPVAETKDELADEENDDEDEEEDQMELDSSDGDPAANGNASSSFFKQRTKKPRFAGSDHPDPELRYLSLSLEHKLDILSFLCQINLQSKVVKAFIDECELRLTEERKEKAEINKEKKELLAEKNALIKPKVKTDKPEDASTGTIAGDGETPAITGNGGASAVAVSSLLAPLRVDDPTSSAAPSEAEDSVMPDEPPSRQPSSSPLPELDDSSSTHSMTANSGRVQVGVNEPDQTNLRSDAPDDTSEPADAGEGQDEIEEDEIEDTKSADGGDEQDELDVGSDIDELQSSVDENEEQQNKLDAAVASKAVPKGPGKGWRKGKGATGAAGKKGSKSVDRKTEIEQELEMNAKKDDLFERDWRRFREVARVRPLGKDRFHQRHWWFDGIGPQSLIAPNGCIIYGTGRLFVQGPSQEDYDMICAEYGGPEAMIARMKYEQGQETLLSVDEWGYYESAEDIEQLCNWLNNKGFREREFKGRLEKWKHYIIEGSKARQADLLHGFEATAPAAHQRRTRGARGSKEFHDNPSKHYLAYENSLAQK